MLTFVVIVVVVVVVVYLGVFAYIHPFDSTEIVVENNTA